jgi:hypothetical protein
MTAPLPSSDLYFANACAPLIARWWEMPGITRERPIQRLSANSFATQGPPPEGWLVLVRRDTPAAMARALRWPGRLAYVVDDDIAGAADSPSLPADYRARLDAFDWDWHGPLLARANVVLASSDVLAGGLARRLGQQLGAQAPAVRRIDPVWHARPASLDHFAALDHGAPFAIAHLGTASHGGALARLAPVIARVLARHPQASFTYVAGAADDPLAGTPRCRRVAPRSWPAWQRWLRGQRFHLALYPLLDEPFDRSRSNAKLWEHAQVGAVGLYRGDWAPADMLGGGAWRAGPHPEDWGDAIECAILTGSALAQSAQRASSQLSACKFCAKQQSLWSTLLEIGNG